MTAGGGTCGAQEDGTDGPHPRQNRPVLWALFPPLTRTVRTYSAGMKSGPSFARCLSTAALVLAPLSWAQSPPNAPSPGPNNGLEQMARDFLQPALGQSIGGEAGVKLRPEVVMGQLDSRLRLAPCGRVEFYLPPGLRLWGNTRLGARCLEGATRWNVTLPVTVQALGTAWVLRRDVAPGSTLEAGDLMPAEVDWAAEPSPVLASREAWIGQVAARALRSGQTLRENMVRAAQVFQAGAQVRVLVQGGGFQISAEGQALSPGMVGQPAKVKMESGRVLTVTVLDARTVRADI